MRKVNIAAIILFAAMIGILSSCASGDKQQDISDNTADADDKGVSLEIWTFLDYNVPGDYYATIWEDLADEYGYDITLKTYSKQEIQDKLNIAVASKELPDIFTVYGGEYPDQLFEAQACIPVQSYVEGSDALFKDTYLVPYKDGNNYIIPCFPEAYAVLYENTDIMKEIGIKQPETWEDLQAAAKKIISYNKKHNTSYTPIQLAEKDAWIGELFYCAAVNALDPYALDGIYDNTNSISDNTFKEAAKNIEKLVDMGAFGENYMDIGEEEALEKFISNEAVFLPHQSTIVYYLMDNMQDGTLDMMAYPTANEEYKDDYYKYQLAVNYTLKPGLCISAYSSFQQEAAQISIEYAKRVNKISVEEYGYIDITRKNLISPAVLPDPVLSLKTMLFNSKHEAPDLYALLQYTQGSTWLNITKKLYATEYDADRFIDAADDIR